MAALIDYSIAGRAFPGEHVSGDRAMVKLLPQGVLAAAVDGLGHGKEAGYAASIAIATLESHVGEDPPTLMQHCHRALRNTHGAAISLASINARDEMMTWLGVGNVDVQLLRTAGSSPTREALLGRGGIVGYQMPSLHAYRHSLVAGDLLIFTTDGIRSDFTAALSAGDPLLRRRPVHEIAESLLARFGKTTDDALVLVIRYLGLAQ